MPPGRTLSLSLPPFTKAVKWLIIVNAAVFLFSAGLQAFAPGLADIFFRNPSPAGKGSENALEFVGESCEHVS